MSDADSTLSGAAPSVLAQELEHLSTDVPEPRACDDVEARRTGPGRSFKPLAQLPVLTPERLVLVKALRTAYLQSELTFRRLVEDHLVHVSRSQLGRLLNGEGRYPDRDTVLSLAAAVKAPQSKSWWTEVWSAGAEAEGWPEPWIQDGKQGAKAADKKARVVNNSLVAADGLNQGKRGIRGGSAKLRMVAALAAVIVFLGTVSFLHGLSGGDSIPRTNDKSSVTCVGDSSCSAYQPSSPMETEVHTPSPPPQPDRSRNEDGEYASRPAAAAPPEENRLDPWFIEDSRSSGSGMTTADRAVALYDASGKYARLTLDPGVEISFECSTWSTKLRKTYLIPLYNGTEVFVKSVDVVVFEEPAKC